MNYYSRIKGVKETEKGTDIIIHIPDQLLQNKILREKIVDAEIRIVDERNISAVQRKKIYATIKDISLFTGDDPEYLKEFLKFDYCGESGEEYFSLSNCSIDTAKEFINHLIEFILRENIPLSDVAINRTDDIDKYLYHCIKYRRCALTGQANADIHHVTGSRIGMGRSRVTINHVGLEIMALNREWHNKVHQEGEIDIFAAYKVYGIKVDAATLNELGIKAEDIS